MQSASIIESSNSTTQSWTYYEYAPTNLQFYQYKQPQMFRMHPHSGLTRGGTLVEVIGLDFRYMPEFGVVPHCKFGDKVVKAEYDSTVRIVCPSPPNAFVDDQMSFEVSLNGVDFTNTGFTFSYYEEPIMTSVFPDSGSAKGGTPVYIEGKNFPKMKRSGEFNCRFTPLHEHMEPKIRDATYLNDTMIMCHTPGGWVQGDKMSL